MGQAAERASPQILVVDDVPRNRALVEAMLLPLGYRIVSVESGARALEVFAERTPDLVLLDVMMPGIDGFETCKRMRRLPGAADVPIVFLTARNDVEAHSEAVESGGDDYLVKPIDRTELVLRVRSLLRLRHATSALRAQMELTGRQRDELLLLHEQKEELTALVVHDLKAPLSVMTMDVDFALHQGTLEPDVRESLENVQQATEQMLRMVMNLLDISRAEDGALTLQLAPVSLVELAADVAKSLQRRLDDRRQRLEVRTTPITVDGDRELLRRVLENLIENACKYTPTNGVIVLETRILDDGKISVEVSDQGPGIPIDAREKVFEKYAQIEGRSAKHSTGLGLVFCRLAIEAHGGRIYVTDNLPRGSRFCLELRAIGARR